MVLEASFLCIDNSDYMRNGDFAPSRMEAQLDAVNLLSGCKTGSNPENTVGLLSTAGHGVEVQVTLTSDVGKVLSLSHGIKIGGASNLSAGIQVAQLSLKHRQNKNQRQRIIVFVGSPVSEEQAALVKLGKKLKKNSVALDIVNFGEEAENTSKLEALLNAVNSDDNSHLVTVPPGPHVLSDILATSPIVRGEDGGAASVPGGGGGGEGGAGDGFTEFGIDPNMDPEFAWALRVSMEEERARQDAESKKTEAAGADGAKTDATPAAADAPAAAEGAAAVDASGADAATADGAGDADMDESALLEAALAMSMPEPAAAVVATPAAQPAPAGDVEMADGGDDDEAMQMALAMSMSQEAETPKPAEQALAPAADLSAVFQDASFLQSVLGSLPGVDPSDPRIQSVIRSANEGEAKPKEGEDKPKGGS